MKKESTDIDVIASENLRKYYLTPNNISDAEFAAVMDMSVSGVRKIKSGESGLTMKKMDVIYKESGVTPNQLYFGEDEPGKKARKNITIGDLIVSVEQYDLHERKRKLLEYAELLLNIANNLPE